jgi:hypothetical protein
MTSLRSSGLAQNATWKTCAWAISGASHRSVIFRLRPRSASSPGRSDVLLPFNREKLRERNAVESEAERQRVSGFAQATSAESSETYDLAAKAKLTILPLRAAQRS